MIRTIVPPTVLPLTLSAHLFSPSVLVPWNIILNEASGSVRVKGEIWTHTDGGDPARLHRIEPANGSVMRMVDVANAVNVDREDITTDGSWLNIGALGNNSGDRTNLRVLRVALDPVLDPLVNTVSAATIGFSYGLQTSFTPALNNNDRDREALVAFNDRSHLKIILRAMPGPFPGIHRCSTLTERPAMRGFRA